ncbi:MAG: hypothetical protein AAFN12_15880, partial [Cyanobacteria bacterium J06560_2]
MTLTSKIQDVAVKEAIAADCAQLIDRQVSAKSGLSGMALKAAYGVVKGIGANYVPGAIKRLLPETCAAIEPMWAEGVAKGDPVVYMGDNRDRAADLILGATDARIERTGNSLISGTYKKLRKSVKSDVVAAVPEVAQILN